MQLKCQSCIYIKLWRAYRDLRASARDFHLVRERIRLRQEIEAMEAELSESEINNQKSTIKNLK